MRLAWFSPMPPVPTGIARCSADLIDALGVEFDIDPFVDQANLPAATPGAGPLLRSAHDFVWRHQQQPYDLVVYQVGNSSHHDYQWPYLFRYPGLAVLHDAHLHHGRAACLLRALRAGDYRREFSANHPDANPDLAELAAAGFDNHLHYVWPMTRLLVARSRRVAVHSPAIAEALRTETPGAAVESIRLGHGVPLTDARAAALGSRFRAHLAIPADALVFGCYGGLTPDKRLPQILAAFASTRAYAPRAHLLLAGLLVPHCDVRGEIRRLGLEGASTVTGYLETDDELTGAIAACDVALNLRWPTAREISGPWLRCLAAGKPTVTIDLVHLAELPSIDPRTWLANHTGGRPPCTIAIDIVDEDHSLRLAMRRLAADAALRTQIGRAAREYWTAHHSIEAMADDYRGLIARAIESQAPVDATGTPGIDLLPEHLLDSGAGTLTAVMQEMGVAVPLRL